MTTTTETNFLKNLACPLAENRSLIENEGNGYASLCAVIYGKSNQCVLFDRHKPLQR